MAGTEAIELARLRDQSAWLRALARRLVGTSAAEDLAQDTMLKAIESPPAEDRPVRPWLVRVLRNTARMRIRAEQRRTRRETAVADTAEPVARDTSVQVLETHRTLCELVLALDEPLRRTIVARYVEGISLAELARRDGVVEATLRWRHARALVLLREALDQRAGGDRGAWMLALAPMLKLPSTTIIAVGGAIVNKLVMAGLVALVAGIGSLWWWRTSRAAEAPTAATAATAATVPTAPPASKAPAPDTQRDAGAAQAPPRVTRMTNAGAQRRQLAERIAAARARRAQHPATPATPASNAMDTPEHVLAQMMTSLEEVGAYVETCVDSAGTGQRGFHADLMLTGDAEVGTLIDSSALSSLDGQPLPAPLDDCVRDVLQSLSLPPMALGTAFKVSYEFTFDDDEAP